MLLYPMYSRFVLGEDVKSGDEALDQIKDSAINAVNDVAAPKTILEDGFFNQDFNIIEETKDLIDEDVMAEMFNFPPALRRNLCPQCLLRNIIQSMFRVSIFLFTVQKDFTTNFLSVHYQVLFPLNSASGRSLFRGFRIKEEEERNWKPEFYGK